MPYTRPPASAANFIDTGTAYTRPAPSAADFIDSDGGPSSVIGLGSVTLAFLAAGAGSISAPAVVGVGSVNLLFTPSGSAAHGIAGQGACILGLAPAGTAAHGIAGQGTAALGFWPAGNAVHPRYQLRGQVLDNGTPVDRRVRVYLRSTGALVAQADTVAGQFALDVGYSLNEYTLLPIDMSSTAEDWAPPAANRVLSVLLVD